MPPAVKQGLLVTALTTISTSLVIAILVGIGTVLFSKSEDVTRVITTMDNFQKNFEDIANNTENLKDSVGHISAQLVSAQLDIRIAIKDMRHENETFQNSIRTKFDVVDERMSYIQGQQKYILGRINPNRVTDEK